MTKRCLFTIYVSGAVGGVGTYGVSGREDHTVFERLTLKLCMETENPQTKTARSVVWNGIENEAVRKGAR